MATGAGWRDLGAEPFSENDYRQTVRVTYERLVKEPDSIVEDLTGRLNRALGGSAPVPHAPNYFPRRNGRA